MMAIPQVPSPCIWKHELFHCEPIWPREPDLFTLTSLSRKHLDIPDDADVEATFLSQGGFNKLYVITSSSLPRDYLFRVTLTVEPYFKTASEAATLKFLRRHTSIPVPDVIAYSATPDKELGYEWIIMEYLPGVCLRDVWPRSPGEKGESVEIATPKKTRTYSPLDWSAKEDVTRTVSEYFNQLKNIPFKSIGSLYFRSDIANLNVPMIETEDSDFVIGPVVSLRLFYGGLRGRVHRNLGPYSSEREYITAWMETHLAELELVRTLDPQDPQYDEDLVETGPEIVQAIMALRKLLNTTFSASSDDRGYILHHADLTLSNILVDPTTSRITGIVDWEATSAVPQWEATYPDFLIGPDVDTDPEPWIEGDTNPCRMDFWESWEKAKLRNIFGPVNLEEDMKRKFVGHLTMVNVYTVPVVNWVHSILNPGPLGLTHSDFPESLPGDSVDDVTVN